jgi:steroid delta-isomerase-like uncharacterized protein
MTPEAAVEERNKELILRMSREIWNQGNLDHMDEMFSNDIVLHFLPDGSDTRGLDDVREHFREHLDAFPDWAEEIKLIVAEGEYVAIHFESSGTNRGRFSGNPPTGRKIRINEVSIFRLVDGKIKEQWLLPDLLGLNEQLGLLSGSN